MQIPVILILEVSKCKVKFFGLVEISYSWIMEHFSEPPTFYLDPRRLLIFRLSVGPPLLLRAPPLLFGTGE